jgi:hypothetical protein
MCLVRCGRMLKTLGGGGERNRVLLLLGAKSSSAATRRLKTPSISSKERVKCANAFRLCSSNLSFAKRSCASVFVAFVAGISSLSMDYITLVPLFVQLLETPPGLFSELPQVFRCICFQLF